MESDKNVKKLATDKNTSLLHKSWNNTQKCVESGPLGTIEGYYDTQHNYTLHNDTQHKGFACDTQHNGALS
jgi:hypothetical protein